MPLEYNNMIPISTCAEIPENSTITVLESEHSNKIFQIIKLLRQDVLITALPSRGVRSFTLACGPDCFQQTNSANSTNQVLVLPATTPAYFHYLAFPLENIDTRGKTPYVSENNFLSYIQSHGDFFGTLVNGEYVPCVIRYQPYLRASHGEDSTVGTIVLPMLSDSQSIHDFSTSYFKQPKQLWKNFLFNLYNKQQYCDYISLAPGNVVINCGVHGGDELPHFISKMHNAGTIVNIDPIGHDYLADDVRFMVDRFSGDVFEIKAAACDKEAELCLPLDGANQACSYNMYEKSTSVNCIQTRGLRIDDIVDSLAVNRVDLIKMDIEGADELALLGSLKTINKFRPQLAISIYHTPDHFTQIPLLLNRECKNYSFYISSYHFISNELVLYAIPNERQVVAPCRRIHVELRSYDLPPV